MHQQETRRLKAGPWIRAAVPLLTLRRIQKLRRSYEGGAYNPGRAAMKRSKEGVVGTRGGGRLSRPGMILDLMGMNIPGQKVNSKPGMILDLSGMNIPG